MFVIISDKFINIRIIDHGIRILYNETVKILNPFERGTNVCFTGGYGIGLSIVKQIVELHYGEIKVKSM